MERTLTTRERTMKRKYPETDTFHWHNENPKGKITGDCVTRAISLALGQAWETTMRENTEYGIKKGLEPCCKECYGSYLESKGWKKVAQPRKASGKKYTAEEFCRRLASKDETYIAHIGGGHIACIKDRKVWDIWDCTDGSVGNYWIKD